jgi:hypothetical protein
VFQYVTQANLKHQEQMLNEDFSGSAFWFYSNRTTRTFRNDWAYGEVHNGTFATDLSQTITAALRIGGPDVANVFLTDGTCETIGGFATIPFFYGMFPPLTYSKRDSIFVCPTALSTTTNAATTLSHEMGHFLGLLHTFEGNNCRTSN